MPVPFRAQIVQMSSGAFMSGTIASEWYPTLPSGHSFFLMAASSSVAGGLHTQDGFHYTPVFVTPDYDVLPLWGSKTELSSLDGTSNNTGLARGTSSVNVTLKNSATRTVPLPPAAEMRGEPLYFRHQGDGSGTLTIQANGADYLDGVLGGSRIVTHLETVIIIGHVDADGTGRYNTYISDDALKSLTGPSITTDNAIARWDGTTGSFLQNSSVIVSDGGDVYIPWAVTASHVALDAQGAGALVVVTGSQNVQIKPGQDNGGVGFFGPKSNSGGWILLGGNDEYSDKGDGGDIVIWPFGGKEEYGTHYGGSFYVLGGDGNRGGAVYIQSGRGVAYGGANAAEGGGIDIFAGDFYRAAGVTSPTSASSGYVNIQVGDADGGGVAGDITIIGGNTNQAGKASDIYITAGSTFNKRASSGGDPSLPTEDAGNVIIQGGDAGSKVLSFGQPDGGGHNGGTVIIRGGLASADGPISSGSGGSIYVDGGPIPSGRGIGPPGNVFLGTQKGTTLAGIKGTNYDFGGTGNVFVGRGGPDDALSTFYEDRVAPVYISYDSSLVDAFPDASIVFSGSIGGKDGAERTIATFIGDVVVSGTLYADGGRKLSRVSAAGTYNLDRSKNIVGCDTSGGAVTVNLFDPASISPSSQVDGYTVIIKDEGGNASTNAITINRGGSSTIDGDTSLVLNIDYTSVTLYCNTTNWFIT